MTRRWCKLFSLINMNNLLKVSSQHSTQALWILTVLCYNKFCSIIMLVMWLLKYGLTYFFFLRWVTCKFQAIIIWCCSNINWFTIACKIHFNLPCSEKENSLLVCCSKVIFSNLDTAYRRLTANIEVLGSKRPNLENWCKPVVYSIFLFLSVLTDN